MIDRKLESTLRKRLNTASAVALLGSRQVGKTTIAKGLKLEKPTHYLDLERPSQSESSLQFELFLQSDFSTQLELFLQSLHA